MASSRTATSTAPQANTYGDSEFLEDSSSFLENTLRALESSKDGPPEQHGRDDGGEDDSGDARAV